MTGLSKHSSIAVLLLQQNALVTSAIVYKGIFVDDLMGLSTSQLLWFDYNIFIMLIQVRA